MIYAKNTEVTFCIKKIVNCAEPVLAQIKKRQVSQTEKIGIYTVYTFIFLRGAYKIKVDKYI